MSSSKTIGLPDNIQGNGMYNTLINNYNGIRNISDINNIFSDSYLQGTGFSNGQDYEKLERARKLSESEFSVNTQLGYISLNQALSNYEVLAVAFQYTQGSQTFQVGELSTTGPDAPSTLILKLLKGTNFSPSLPNWDLMMKNIYAIGDYQMSRDGFI